MIGILTAVMSIAGSYAGVLSAGGAIGSALEMAIPWLTRVHQARKAARVARQLRRRVRKGKVVDG